MVVIEEEMPERSQKIPLCITGLGGDIFTSDEKLTSSVCGGVRTLPAH